MAARPASRVEAVLAARAAGGSGGGGDAPGGRLRVRVDRVLVDAAVTAELLAAAGATGARPRLAEPTRWAFIAGPELPTARRLELAECVSALGAAVSLEPALAGLPG